MDEKSIEKEDCNEFKEKERMLEKESLSENSCYFYSISTLCEKLEKDECSKEIEHKLEKSESTKDNEYFIEKQESIEKEQKKKKKIYVCTNKTHFILVRYSSCLHNFFTQNLENEESLDYNINKTISFFEPISDKCFDHFLKGTKLNSFALISFIGILLNILALGHQNFEGTTP
ncbi:hypothetical protein M9H77_12716 [Catharanthus roseus]|uniref:Uncharacterized protein n=1 Tax=Catharanthus roseus TaxID=4058 RepID=A0ACC0BI76_CATRO|nr:hypothetical protein M9H77_12716 [Catharanthus roseus]